MPQLLRYDRGAIKAVETGEGFLRAKVVMAVPGVYPYMDAAGSVKLEAKLPDELSNKVTIATADGKPATDGHPPKSDNHGLVVSDNYQRYTKGSITSPAYENGELVSYVTVYDAALIKDILEKRKVQVSLGQLIKLDSTPGNFNGYRYDSAQRNIRINHLAFVEAGRLGDKAKIILDEKDLPEGAAVRVDNDSLLENAKIKNNFENKSEPKKENNTMGDIVLKQDSEDYALWKSIKGFFKKIGDPRNDAADKGKVTCPECGHKFAPDQRTDASDAKAADLQKRIDSMQITIDTLQAQNTAFKGELEKTRNDSLTDAALGERMKLIDMAKSVRQDFKHDGLSNRDIKLSVISTNLPYTTGTDIAKLDDAHVNARYDAACELAKVKASQQPNSETSFMRVDEADLKKKKEERLNLHKVS
jgi:hypothetical protein